ncbi:DUF945 family protein [Campylobacter suis]|uniref:DUF945 domain-containing protein n=1 Tax=Campylobacter suis TaxID=2790657 RepID=A0ABN7K3U6_9BACT|nr:DUF945 family protein [Campylobacter suis]CAD7287097.1 hypothetical protein LMG8286_00728 [Campylobacter suis]
MKKIFISIGVAAALLAGGNYFVSQSVEQSYKNTLKNLQAMEGVSISNDSYERGFLNSKASFDMELDQKILPILDESFGESDTNKALKINIKSDISNNLFSLINGFKSSSSIAILNGQAQEALKEVFGSNIIATAHAKSSIFDSKQDMSINLKDISFKQDLSELKTQGVKLDIVADKTKLSSGALSFDKILFSQESDNFIENSIKIELEKLNYDLAYKEPIEFKEIEYNLAPYIYDASIKNTKITVNENEVLLYDMKANGNSSYGDTSKTLFNSKDILSISKINVGGVEFKEFAIKMDIKNLHIQSVKKIIDVYSNLSEDEYEVNYEKLTPVFLELSKAKPELNLNEFSVKNAASNKLNITTNFALKESPKDINSLMDTIKFDGVLSIEPNIASFLSQFPDIASLAMMLEQLQILKTEKDIQKMTFRFEPKEQDIIINEEQRLGDLLRGF